MSGTTVYAICNHVTGDAYVGEASQVDWRWRDHRGMLRKGRHHNRALQAAWDSCGAESFGLMILERVTEVPPYGRTVLWCQQQEARWLVRARVAGVVLYNAQVGRGRGRAA